MLFNSFQFMIFLPIVFALYWLVGRARDGRRWQNLVVVGSSYVFYGWWDWRFLSLILLTSVCSYASGLLIDRLTGRERMRWLVSAANIVINLAVLGYFKYADFFASNLEALLLSVFGYHLDWVTTDVVLPVGISFYTFQALSYSIDVYRGRLRPTKDLTEFLAFISFFPQLVAGPIERATHLLPQFQRERHFDYGNAVDGLRQMLWGLLKKVVVADNCATIVNIYWDGYSQHTGLMLLALGILFTIQIYCDFSGYSDIAIGCAKLFGFELMRNFNNPYFSRSIPEFWRRWHISLTTWFRDYVYIPMGGNRCAKWRVIVNIYVVWTISGLWHGAGWTFVCWGLFHGTLLALYYLLGINTKQAHVVAHGRLLPSAKELLQMTLTMLLATLGWIIFRSEDMTQAVGFISHMVQTLPDNLSVASIYGKRELLMGLAVLLIEWMQRERQHGLQLGAGGLLKYSALRLAIYAIAIVIMFMWAGQVQTFIYFQF